MLEQGSSAAQAITVSDDEDEDNDIVSNARLLDDKKALTIRA